MNKCPSRWSFAKQVRASPGPRQVGLDLTRAVSRGVWIRRWSPPTCQPGLETDLLAKVGSRTRLDRSAQDVGLGGEEAQAQQKKGPSAASDRRTQCLPPAAVTVMTNDT